MPSTRNFITAGLLFLTGLFLTTMACASLLGAVSRPAPTAIPATADPTDTDVPLYQQVTMSATAWQEQGQSPSYMIEAQIPVLVGSSDPRVKAFNAEMKGAADSAIATFKQNLANIAPTPNSTSSYFQLRYSLVSAPGDILSVKFDIQTFYTGAAHPGDASQTATFDLERGQDVSLADLFAPGSDYLAAISKYCSAQLSTRDIGFQGFELGATATSQNYRNWNITADGLMITFDEYQVAPYAAGPQTVVIPYKELAKIIQPAGALGSYLR